MREFNTTNLPLTFEKIYVIEDKETRVNAVMATNKVWRIAYLNSMPAVLKDNILKMYAGDNNIIYDVLQQLKSELLSSIDLQEQYELSDDEQDVAFAAYVAEYCNFIGDARDIIEYVDQESGARFETTKDLLDEVVIEFEVNFEMETGYEFTDEQRAFMELYFAPAVFAYDACRF